MKRAYLIGLYLVGMLWPLGYWKLLSTYMRDFASFWVAGRAVWAGIDPYDIVALRALGDPLLGVGGYNFTYPPHSLFIFVPLSLLPAFYAFLLWDFLSVAFFWWASKPLIPKGFPTILAVLSPAAIINLNYGQTGLVCAGLFLLAFRPSGLAAAALTFKPHLGFLAFPALLRHRREFAVAVIASIALFASSALVFGHWVEFIKHAVGFQGAMLVDQTQSQWLFMGTSPGIGYTMWGWLIFATGGVYILSRNFNVFTAATATFLIAPYGLHYDMAAVCLGFAVMLYKRWDDMPRSDIIAASLAFLTPLLVVYATTWVVPPLLLWGLVVQSNWTDGTRIKIERDERKRFQFRVEPAFAGQMAVR